MSALHLSARLVNRPAPLPRREARRWRLLLRPMACGGLACAVVFAGCISERAARERAHRAHLEGARRGAAAAQAGQQQAPMVVVLGDVRHNTVPWSEGLTLTQAIAAAHHARRQPPRGIVLRRGHEAVRLLPESLLQGGPDPLLAPGDVIELLR